MILTINCGSSSLKYQLYTADLSQVLAAGLVAKIGERGSYYQHSVGDRRIKVAREIADHRMSFGLMLENLLSKENGVIGNTTEITAIGHRAVHGGSTFVESVIVDSQVMRGLNACAAFAPLHNPCNIIGIEEAQRLFPGTPNVVVFDTAFHQTVPAQAHVYALPYDLYSAHGIRRYGFHGTSCRYVAGAAAEQLGRPLEDLSMIICHLGNGVTIDAVKGGKSIDTSIGFGTLSGIPMGTRSGDFDPAIIFHMVNALGMSLQEVETICYKKSGLLGLSGLSNDMREVSEAAAAGNARCQLAIDVFTYNIRKQIGGYAVAMNKLDALVFTAGIGENSAEVRSRICSDLDILGIAIDEQLNWAAKTGHPDISVKGMRAAVLVVPTDEERMIAIDTLNLTSEPPLKRRAS